MASIYYSERMRIANTVSGSMLELNTKTDEWVLELVINGKNVTMTFLGGELRVVHNDYITVYPPSGPTVLFNKGEK